MFIVVHLLRASGKRRELCRGKQVLHSFPCVEIGYDDSMIIKHFWKTNVGTIWCSDKAAGWVCSLLSQCLAPSAGSAVPTSCSVFPGQQQG